MPTPWDIERQRSFRASPPQKLHRYTPDHMLFQLEPRLEILRPETDAWIMDLIHIIDGDAKSGRKGGVRFGAEGGSGIFLDFDKGIATIRSLKAAENETNQNTQSEKPSTPQTAYRSISTSTNGEGEPASEWETRLQIQKLELYDLGGHTTVPFEEQLAAKPQLRTASPEPYQRQVSTGGPAPAAAKPSEPQVGDEELRKRITGFGCGA